MLMALAFPVYAVGKNAYWHESSAACSNPDWMGRLSDSKHLNDISIPGTHDTMAYQGSVILKDIVLTQTMNLKTQLNSGIRYLDIRLCYKGSYFEIHHGVYDLRVKFDTVLDTIQSFLGEHEGEFIVMRLQQENSSASRSEMDALMDKYTEKYPGLFYSGNETNPTVGSLRGTIFTVGNNVKSSKSYGSIYEQDFYNFTTNWDLYKKWELVKEQLEAADNGNGVNLYLNHLTGSGGSFPYFVASGKASHGTNAIQLSTGIVEKKNCKNPQYPEFPRKSLLFGTQEVDFMGMNQMATDYITGHNLKNVGIIAADFPGEALISAVIGCNF